MAEHDILLYGCNVAAGKGGVAFVDSLSAITRADVAAATRRQRRAGRRLGAGLPSRRHRGHHADRGALGWRDGDVHRRADRRLHAGRRGDHDKLVAYGGGNTFVFNNSSTAATTTIELRQGMKQENGVWVRNQDDANDNNTLDFSAIKATSPPSSATTTATRSATPRSTPTTTGPSARSTWCSSRPTAARA